MRKIKGKKNLFILILLIVISSTVAYLYSTDTFQNIFVAASYKVVVTETFESPDNWKPGDTTPKTATLKNEGTVPIKVRVKLEEEWKDSNNQDLPLQHNDENVAIINFSNEDDYIYKDGYYYYDLALNPGETTSSIIESVTFNPNYSGTVTCVENDDSTHTCSSSESGYEGGTYKLTLTIEGVQEDFYVQAWGLSGVVEKLLLYNVLKNESENGDLAREYTGEHHDSFTEEPLQKIYHWYAKNDTEGTQIQNKNNVIFADQCWQMIRTTDTGGVKMIYNGEAVDNQCLSTRGTHVGYTYRTSQNLASNYWYGTDYTYDSTAKTFKISGPTEQTIWNATTGPGLVGKYTCKSTSVDGTCATLYLVESYESASSAYVIPLNSNSNYSQFGTLPFNASYNSPSYVGYMYNTVYPYNLKKITSTETMLSISSLATTYWYAHDAVWGTPTANSYNLDNPYQVSATTDYPNLVGEYTFSNTTKTYTNSNVYYIAAVNNTTMYSIQLTNARNHTLADFNYTYTYGESFTDNGNGTYTINNPTTVNRSDWYTSYSNVGANKYVCKNAVNDTCSELWYTTETSTTSMKYIKIANNYKYAKGFTWDGNKYILDSNSVTFFEWNDENKASINNAHYTCWNATGECTTVSYIYYISGTTPYHIDITEGKNVETALNEMLYDDNVNTTNSTIKSGVDAWYKHYLLEDYDDYIEDTIFCNDRSVRSLGGWNLDGGSTTAILQFKEYKVTTDLSCANDTDKFSISNNNAKLTYKVGLMSSSEMNIMNNANARKTGQWYWLASPLCFDAGYAYGRFVGTGGGMDNNDVYLGRGVRPAVSLTSGIEYYTGDGSMANPYIVKTE